MKQVDKLSIIDYFYMIYFSYLLSFNNEKNCLLNGALKFQYPTRDNPRNYAQLNNIPIAITDAGK